jgi:hypothetical protein
MPVLCLKADMVASNYAQTWSAIDANQRRRRKNYLVDTHMVEQDSKTLGVLLVHIDAIVARHVRG